MKKLINNFTGKEDYFLNYNEAAEHLQMTIGRLKYLYTDDCKLHPDFLPKSLDFLADIFLLHPRREDRL